MCIVVPIAQKGRQVRLRSSSENSNRMEIHQQPSAHCPLPVTHGHPDVTWIGNTQERKLDSVHFCAGVPTDEKILNSFSPKFSIDF